MSEFVTACEPSLPLPEGGYVRTFEAEIDDHGPQTIRVCGVLADHRCRLEHVWILQAPEYEVIDASARHLHGDPTVLAPQLISRYPDICGVRIGSGFTRAIREALGDLPGQPEHLTLAIEMARAGQQVYKLPRSNLERFAPLVAHMPEGPSRQSRLLWEQDRDYMPALLNSCYAYRDETLPLFDERDIVSIDYGVANPELGRKRIFWRNKRLHIAPCPEGGGFHCRSEMEDTIHEIRVAFDIDPNGVIQAAQSDGVRLPFHGICETPHQRTPGLDGQKLSADFVRLIADQIGGASGCAHLFDLSVDCLRFFNWPR